MTFESPTINPSITNHNQDTRLVHTINVIVDITKQFRKMERTHTITTGSCSDTVTTSNPELSMRTTAYGTDNGDVTEPFHLNVTTQRSSPSSNEKGVGNPPSNRQPETCVCMGGRSVMCEKVCAPEQRVVWQPVCGKNVNCV